MTSDEAREILDSRSGIYDFDNIGRIEIIKVDDESNLGFNEFFIIISYEN